MTFIQWKMRITLLLLVFAAMLLGGCSGGSGGDSAPGADAPGITVAGAGVKGPLAGAVVNLYQVDLSATDLKGSLLDQGSTDAAAAFQGLALPAGTTGLVLVEVVADADTIDVTSGAYPVLDTLYTVVDAQRIIDGHAVYATPLTTMAVKLARAKADTGAPYSGDGNDTITRAEFTAAVQEQVVRYRQAIEALAAVLQQVADDSSATDTPQQIFDALIDDLADGQIDGENSGVPVAALAALDTPIDTTPATVLNLDAVAEPGRVTLTWSETSAAANLSRAAVANATRTAAATKTYNLYYATEPDCDVSNYASCEGGAKVADVASPYVVDNLVNGENYWFKVEAQEGGDKAVSKDEGARPDRAITDGEVYAIAQDADGVTYLGGTFTRVGMRASYGVTMDANEGHLGAYPMVNDVVQVAVSDGFGGFYVGGAFTDVGGSAHNHLVHILASGALDDTWNPDVDGTVYALYLSGNTLYVGGEFTSIDDGRGAQTRKNLAALDTGGTLDDTWNPNVGGEFYSIGDEGVNEEYRFGLAAIGTDGTFSSWYPGPGEVDALALSGTTLYAGGYFDYAGTQTRHNLAAFDITTIDTTDEPTAWDQGVDSWVNALLVTHDAVYAGGHFTRVNDALSPYLAILAP